MFVNDKRPLLEILDEKIRELQSTTMELVAVKKLLTDNPQMEEACKVLLRHL